MFCGMGLDIQQSSGRVSMCCLSHWSGQQQHLLKLASIGYTINAVCSSPWQRTLITGAHGDWELHAPWRGPSKIWQDGGGSFLVLPRRHVLSSRWLWTFNHNMWKLPGRSLRSCYQVSPPASSLPRHMAMCTALVSGAQCSMPVRLGYWQSQTSDVCSQMTHVCSQMTKQWSDRLAMSSQKTLSPPDAMSYLQGLTMRIWTLFWKRRLHWYRHVECSNGAI